MNFQRPVLVILDRNMDLIPMISHSWTYQALVHDVMEMKLNEIVVQVWAWFDQRTQSLWDNRSNASWNIHRALTHQPFIPIFE